MNARIIASFIENSKQLEIKHSNLDQSYLQRYQQKCVTQADSQDEENDENDLRNYYGSISKSYKKNHRPYYQIKKRFLDEEKDQNSESDVHLPTLENRSYLPILNERQTNRVKSVQYNGGKMEPRSNSILKNTKFEEQVSQYIHSNKNQQKSVDKEEQFKQFYNDDEPQPISTKKMKRRVVSFHNNNNNAFAPIQSITPLGIRNSFSSKVSPLQSKNSIQNQHQDPYEQGNNSQNTLSQQHNLLRVSELKERQIERTSRNIQELKLTRSYENERKNVNQNYNPPPSYSSQDDDFERNDYLQNLRGGRDSSTIKEYEEYVYNQNIQRVTPFEEYEEEEQDVAEEPRQIINRKQKYMSNDPIIEMVATESVKTSQNRHSFQSQSISLNNNHRNSKNSNILKENNSQHLKQPSVVESFGGGGGSANRASVFGANFNKSSNEIPSTKVQRGKDVVSASYNLITKPQKQVPQQITVIDTLAYKKQSIKQENHHLYPQQYPQTQYLQPPLAQQQFLNNQQQQQKVLSPFQQYLQDEKYQYMNEQRSTPIKKYDRKINYSPNQQQPVSDYQMIKKLEHSSPILKQLKVLDRSFEEEQKDNKELINKMNQCYMREKEETELLNRVSKTSKPSYKSPLSGLQPRPQRSIHSHLFSNVNKSLNRKSSKGVLQLDLPEKDCKILFALHYFATSLF